MTEFIQRHIGITETEQTQMLKDLGLSSLEELVREVVPTSILLRGDDNLPEPCSEQQALEELKEIAEHNIVRRTFDWSRILWNNYTTSYTKKCI